MPPRSRPAMGILRTRCALREIRPCAHSEQQKTAGRYVRHSSTTVISMRQARLWHCQKTHADDRLGFDACCTCGRFAAGSSTWSCSRRSPDRIVVPHARQRNRRGTSLYGVTSSVDSRCPSVLPHDNALARLERRGPLRDSCRAHRVGRSPSCDLFHSRDHSVASHAGNACILKR